MGDTDSRASARAAALDRLRMQAAGEAGVYVEGRTTLRGDQLEEQITQIRGALVQLESLEERFEPQTDGYTRLTLRARARVDDSLLAQRVAALRQDAEKTRRMAQLAQENAVLRAGLSALARERLQAIDAERQALLDNLYAVRQGSGMDADADLTDLPDLHAWSRDWVEHDLAQVRAAGCAVRQPNAARGSATLAVPVCIAGGEGRGGEAVAALSMTTFGRSMTAAVVERHRPILAETAEAIAVAFGAQAG
ncbi:MAG TPA: hypothetical protein PKE61_07065 [Burkholderiaceae bacterium]|nr:hypothetical protein [Burkholderiaceae bacterium]